MHLLSYIYIYIYELWANISAFTFISIYIFISSVSLHTHRNISKIAHSPPRAHYPTMPFSAVIKIFSKRTKGSTQGWQIHQQYTDSSPPWSPLCLQAVTARAFICNRKKTTLKNRLTIHNEAQLVYLHH